MATLKEIAEITNVSVNTVSRVLNGKSKEVWPRAKQQADEIRAVARRLNYVPNSAARAMRTNRHQRIAVVIPGNYSSPFDFEVIMGAEKVFKENGYAMSLVSTSELINGTLTDKAFDGVMVRHTAKNLHEYITGLAEATVWVDSNVFEPYNCIRRNEIAAGELAARKVLEQGYRELIFAEEEYDISGEDAHFCRKGRYSGVMAALADYPDAKIVRLGLPNLKEPDLEDKISQQEKAVGELLSCPGKAVITMDFSAAAKVAAHATVNGLCAGRDFAIAACSDTYKTHNLWPRLSRVRFNRFSMGRRAAEMLLCLLKDKDAKCPSLSVKYDWVDGTTVPKLG